MACRKVRGLKIPAAFINLFPELSNRWGSEAETNMWRLKISHDTVVQDLKQMIEILDKIKEQEKPPKTTNSSALTAW
jgi:hypothetical protein